MSYFSFVRSAIKNCRQVGAILPSSSFLADKIVDPKIVKKSNVIVEIWAGTWSFTEKIFDCVPQDTDKQIFIIEKDKSLYRCLLKRFPKYKRFIFNEDVLNLTKFLKNKWIIKVDMVVSWLPYLTLPKHIFKYVMDDFLATFFTSTSIYLQFSYAKYTQENYKKYFHHVKTKTCILNIPMAHVFKCEEYKTR